MEVQESTGLLTFWKEKKYLLIILGLALVLRLTFFLLNRQNNPLFYNPIMDPLYHDQWARKIISGNFWGSEVFFRAPLYPYFLALLYKLSGTSMTFAILIQHLIGAMSATLIYVLSRIYFTKSISFGAGLIAAFYWPFVYFEGQLLIVTFIIFLDLLFLIALSLAIQNNNQRVAFISGILLGLSATARPSILILLPVMPFAFYFGSQSRRASQKRAASIWEKWAKQTTIAIAGSALVISPLLVRNYIVGMDLVPIAAQGGVNFYIGNNPESDGRTAIVPGTRPDWWGGYYDAINLAEKSAGRKLKPSEVSNHYFKKGLSFIVSSPGKAGKLLLHKFRLFWSAGERANNQNIYFFWHLSGMGSIPLPGFWLICPLGMLGGVLLWRNRAALSVLYLFIVSYSAGVITFFVNARFRLPVIPVLLIFASYSLFYLYSAYKDKSFTFLKSFFLLFLLAAAVNVDFITFGENKVYADSISHCALGNAYLKMGRGDQALREYEKALENYKKYPITAYSLIARNVDFNLGALYSKRGMCKKAIELLNRVGGSDHYAVLARLRLAECYIREGMLDEAAESYDQALAMNPRDLDSLLGLARLLIRLNNKDRAKQVLLRAKSFFPNNGTIEAELLELDYD